ncbi:MFS transporter [Tunturibacter psychrotolerans]|uniref:MFS transporter n=1 Tax=Tunturiibacter psychrotolerans TaxID=3069686 RepID=A0AAU7ZTE5_9BACT
MSYLAGGSLGGLESWEEEFSQRLSQSLIQLSQRHRLIILFSVGLVTAIEISNRLSINVLLPDLQGNVAGTSDEVSWVVILYNLGFLCSMAISYWMTRVLGSRRHLLLSIALYATGAIGCFSSPHSLKLLLISRVVMGFGGGAFLVRTVILIRLMFPGKAGIFAVSCLYIELCAFEAVYPVAMGWISDTLRWNYAFLLDFPFLAIGTFLIWKYLPWGHLSLRSEKSYFDAWGGGLLIAALGSMQIALSRGERDLWFQSPFIVCFLVIAVVCFAGFLWWDWRPENPAPVLHLRTIWRQASLRTYILIVAIVGAMLGAGLYVLPQYLRFVQDYSAAQTGGFISTYTIGLGIGLLMTVRYGLPRLGGVKVVAVGASMMTAACTNFIYIWTPTTPTWLLVLSIFALGLSMGPLVSGASNIATSQAASFDLNDVSTSYFFIRQLGNTFGVTAATVMFDRRQTLHSARLVDVANRLDPTLQSTLAQYSSLIERDGGAASNPALGAIQIFQSNVITQSRLLSYIDIYFGLAVLGVVVLILLLVAHPKNAAAPARPHFHLW